MFSFDYVVNHSFESVVYIYVGIVYDHSSDIVVVCNDWVVKDDKIILLDQDKNFNMSENRRN